MFTCLSYYFLIYIFSFFFESSVAHRDLHSFPTQRSSDLLRRGGVFHRPHVQHHPDRVHPRSGQRLDVRQPAGGAGDRKSTRLNSSHRCISYAVFCLKKKKTMKQPPSSNETKSQLRNNLLT